MPELNANIPIIECYVRGNYLRDQQDSHDKYFPVAIFGVASVVGRSPLFHFMMEDGGLWWRAPISAFCAKPGVPEVDIHDLVLWNSFSPNIAVTKFYALDGMRVSYMDRHKNHVGGKYLFTLAWSAPVCAAVARIAKVPVAPVMVIPDAWVRLIAAVALEVVRRNCIAAV